MKLSPEEIALNKRIEEILRDRPTGTINCLAVDANGDISGVTTTSGLAWKIPGRVGDSPLIGCGLYVDNEVGAAGSTGRGEECIYINGAHTVVENMRRGMSPTDAAMDAVKRVAAITKKSCLRSASTFTPSIKRANTARPRCGKAPNSPCMTVERRSS